MRPPFPGDAPLALDDSRPEAEARDAGIRLPALCLGISLALHLLTAAIALGLGHISVNEHQDAGSGPLVITVSLAAGVEDGDVGGGEPAPAEAYADQAADDSPPDVAIAPLTEENTPQPEPAVVLRKPEKKTPPKSVPRTPPKRSAAKAAAAKDGPPAKSGSRKGSGQAGSEPGSGSSRAAGGGGGAAYVKGNYEYIKKRIRQYLVYSPQARRMGIQGMVTVSFTIGPDGRARNISVAGTSGHGSLDESAIRAVQNASPFPPPPAPARITVPVIFSLK